MDENAVASHPTNFMMALTGRVVASWAGKPMPGKSPLYSFYGVDSSINSTTKSRKSTITALDEVELMQKMRALAGSEFDVLLGAAGAHFERAKPQPRSARLSAAELTALADDDEATDID